jgi:hypothetical protein
MLEGLEPSIALTGGPWYTDNELDTEFIEHLRGACLKFIRDVVRPTRLYSEFVILINPFLSRVSRSVAEKVLRVCCTGYLTPQNILLLSISGIL